VTDSQAIIKPYLENLLKQGRPITDVMIVAFIDKEFVTDICAVWDYVPIYSETVGDWTSFRAVKIEVC
jgi:hypothetical protein